MKIATGTISDGAIILDEPTRLPNKTRVKVAFGILGPDFDDSVPYQMSEEELQIVKGARKRLGRITAKECG